jgi:phosphoribosylpyrophosphate synthetase
MEAAVRALWAAGATDIAVAAVHLLLSPPGAARIEALRADAAQRGVSFSLAATNTVQPAYAPVDVHWFGIEPLLARVIHSVNTRGSVRALE